MNGSLSRSWRSPLLGSPVCCELSSFRCSSSAGFGASLTLGSSHRKPFGKRCSTSQIGHLGLLKSLFQFSSSTTTSFQLPVSICQSDLTCSLNSLPFYLRSQTFSKCDDPSIAKAAVRRMGLKWKSAWFEETAQNHLHLLSTQWRPHLCLAASQAPFETTSQFRSAFSSKSF